MGRRNLALSITTSHIQELKSMSEHCAGHISQSENYLFRNKDK